MDGRAGVDNRRKVSSLGEVQRSFSVAVLAREGRGGGEEGGANPLDLFMVGTESVLCALAAKGSCSGMRAVTVDEVPEDRLCLRARGLGFWSELRTRVGEAGEDVSVGVFERAGVAWGGGGACLEGTKGVYLAASAA